MAAATTVLRVESKIDAVTFATGFVELTGAWARASGAAGTGSALTARPHSTTGGRTAPGGRTATARSAGAGLAGKSIRRAATRVAGAGCGHPSAARPALGIATTSSSRRPECEVVVESSGTTSGTQTDPGQQNRLPQPSQDAQNAPLTATPSLPTQSRADGEDWLRAEGAVRKKVTPAANPTPPTT